MWHQIKQYFRFLLQSTNHHGVHSPFVYQLVTKCLYDRSQHADYLVLKQYRNTLLNNKNTIVVTDFGSGSRVFKSRTRSISKITKYAGATPKRMQLLYRLAHYFKPNGILELGTSLGLSAAALHLGNPEAKLITIEGCPKTAKTAQQQFQQFNFQDIDVKVNTMENELAKLTTQQFDMIYIDGNHNKTATIQYFEMLLKTISNDSIIIFDDIHWSKSMTQAWNTIKQHPKVTVSIDLFFCGLICFRTEQAKQHFTIRI